MAFIFAGSIFAQQNLRDYSAPRIHKQNIKATTQTRSVTAYQINEDFNNGMPANWTTQSPDGGSGWTTVDVGTSPVPGWQGGTVTDHTGATTGAVAFCTWNTGGSSANDQWLISPQVAITNGDALNFWLQRNPDAYADNVDILLSTTGNNTSDFTVTLAQLTFGADDGQADWTEYNYDLSAYDGQNVYIAFREHVADNQNDGSAIFLDDVTIGQPEPWDAAITSLTIAPYVTLGNVDVTGVIKNIGVNTITSLDLTWTDGTNQHTETLSGLSIATGQTYEFTASEQLNVTNAVPYNISAWVTLANDADVHNDTATTVVTAVSELVTKKVVGEEAGGTWCGWCVRGIVALKDLAHNYPDTWIGIAVHNGDPMVVNEYDGNMNVGGYPSGYVDRADGEVDPGNFEDVYLQRKDMVPPVKIEVVNEAWDAATSTMSFDVKATFVTQLNGNFRLNAVITEDNVTGTGSDWNQANYYSSQSYDIDLTDWEGINYKNLPNPIPAADMVYNEVARAILGGFTGVDGSVPASVNDGDVATYSFSYTVPSGQKPEDMHLIGMIIDQNTGEIVNADMIESPVTTGVTKVENTSINIYPNPSTGLVNIKGADNSRIEVLNSVGQLVLTVSNASNMETVNLSNFDNGTYIIRITTNEQVSVKKINIQK